MVVDIKTDYFEFYGFDSKIQTEDIWYYASFYVPIWSDFSTYRRFLNKCKGLTPIQKKWICYVYVINVCMNAILFDSWLKNSPMRRNKERIENEKYYSKILKLNWGTILNNNQNGVIFYIDDIDKIKTKFDHVQIKYRITKEKPSKISYKIKNFVANWEDAIVENCSQRYMTSDEAMSDMTVCSSDFPFSGYFGGQE